MGDSDLESASTTRDLIRSIFAFLDRPAYWLLGIVYQLFFNVASADIFSNNTIMKFYGRVQVILGVFMMFQLAMVFLRGIIDPDTFSKEKGGGSLLKRVAISLILITLLMPISITSPRNEYEKQINNNGLLFGTLYSLQHRILSNNTIGRLVLGTNDSDTTFVSDDDDELAYSSRVFTSTILKAFYRINLLPEGARVDTGTKDPATSNKNRVCQNIESEVLSEYTRLDADPGTIISMVNETCENNESLGNRIENGFSKAVNVGLNIITLGFYGKPKVFKGKTNYIFSYMPLISTIVAIAFVFILLSFTIDIAVRAIKLAVLRLIAPIPLIAYMDPKGSGDEAFKSWTKTLTSTYLDLFIRLAVVYFVIFIIQDMIKNGIVIEHGSGVIGVLSLILLWIGLFVFAKQAPKFIKQVLGLKDSNFNLFGGLTAMAAAGTIGAGAVSGAISRGTAQSMKGDTNKGKNFLAGVAGFVGGGVNAGKGYFSSKDFDAKGNMSRIREYNARNYSNAADASTFGGRFTAGLQRDLGMRNSLQQMDDQIKYFGAAESALGRINKAFDGNGDYKHVFRGLKDANGNYTNTDIKDKDGNTIFKVGEKYSLKDYKDTLNRVQASGDNTLIKSVDDVMKDAQNTRLTYLRSLCNDEKGDFVSFEYGKERLQKLIDSTRKEDEEFTTNDMVAFESSKTIYDVSQKYPKEAMFSKFQGKKFGDESLKWGPVFKWSAGQAGKAADQIKNSDAYFQAKANAQRAEQKK